jgi:hypothetical protein
MSEQVCALYVSKVMVTSLVLDAKKARAKVDI